MAETEMYTGVVTALLNKYADPILKGVTGFAKDGWEKFKVDFDIVFRKYLKNSVEKYGRINKAIRLTIYLIYQDLSLFKDPVELENQHF